MARISDFSEEFNLMAMELNGRKCTSNLSFSIVLKNIGAFISLEYLEMI